MPARTAGARRVLLPLLATLALSIASPVGALAHRATASSSTAAATAAKPFTLDLSSKGDFVAQTNFVQCVGASMQMMLNMIRATDDRTDETQADLQVLARGLSGQRPDGNERKGASVRGWTAGLNVLGAGPYRTVGTADLQAALKLAARAMRETGRPVGLLVWRGRHAWVMAGFTATADPRRTDDFEVTRAIILDPLYPYGSKVWGASPKPRQALTVEQLGEQFVPRGFRGGASVPGGSDGGSGEPAATNDPSPDGSDPAISWSQGLSGKYVIVMPYVNIQPIGLRHAPR
jgi:hypothetical protein